MENFFLFVEKDDFDRLPEKIKIINVREPEILEKLKKSKRVRYIPALCIKGDHHETMIYGKSKIQEYLSDLEQFEKEETVYEKPFERKSPEKQKGFSEFPISTEPVPLPMEDPSEFISGEPLPATEENIKPVIEEQKKIFAPNFDDK